MAGASTAGEVLPWTEVSAAAANSCYDGENGAPAVRCPALGLPADVLKAVLARLDLPCRMAAASVCKEWRQASSDPSLWASISVPRDKAFRLWDPELIDMLGRCKGRLTALHVSGSGITGRSLIRIIQLKALAPVVDELCFDHCCNLKLCDILAFVQALAPSPPTSPRRHHYRVRAGPTQGAPSQPWNLPLEEVDTSSADSSAAGPLAVKDMGPAPAAPVKIRKLRVEGCKQMGAWEVQQLQGLVGELDVSICACGRVGVLQRCAGGRPPSDYFVRQEHEAGIEAGAGAAPMVAAVAGALAVPGAPAGSAMPRKCPGLCNACAEVFKGCGDNVCGACWEPRALRQALRNRMWLWQARREAMSVLRQRWTDVRFGVELRPVPAEI